ncbi:Transmembrane protein 97 [Terramyces sp. JEL0728]|nr:Transmembrane protein 97 [Terramyces sp. JEL0728]
MRALDLVYLGFFASHIPASLFIDGQVLFPKSFFPDACRTALQHWVGISKDPWMTQVVFDQPVDHWFKSIIFGEFIFQLPLFFYFIYAILNGIRATNLKLLYSAHVCTTMIPILGELLVYKAPLESKIILMAAYLPYLIIPLIFMVDTLAHQNKTKLKKE